MRKKIMVFSAFVVLACSAFFITNYANIFATDVKEKTDPDDADSQIEYEDDTYVVESREITYESQEEHRKMRKKLQKEQESRSQTDDNVLVYEDDELVITGRDVDVSGKTFRQVQKEKRKEAKKNGGVIGEQ